MKNLFKITFTKHNINIAYFNTYFTLKAKFWTLLDSKKNFVCNKCYFIKVENIIKSK